MIVVLIAMQAFDQSTYVIGKLWLFLLASGSRFFKLSKYLKREPNCNTTWAVVKSYTIVTLGWR